MNNSNDIKLVNENGAEKTYGEIHDLWHLSQAIRDGMDFSQHDDEQRRLWSEMILQVWHMAHDLKAVVERQGEARIEEVTQAQPHPVAYNLGHVIELAQNRATMWQQYADGVNILDRLSEFYECDKEEAESIAHDSQVSVDRVQDWYKQEVKRG